MTTACEWLLLVQTTVSSGSVPPVRAARKQSSEQRLRERATLGQLYLALLPLEPALPAGPNVSSEADTVSTSGGSDRLLSLRSCP